MIVFMQVSILIVLIFLYLRCNKAEAKKERTDYKNRTIEYSKEYNRTILQTLGNDAYINKYGAEAYESIINNTDVKSYK